MLAIEAHPMPTTFDARQAECLVFTFKDGVMQRLAHDLKLRVERLSIERDDERSVRASFDAASLVVVCARKDGADDPSALSQADKRTILDTLRREVLAVATYPTITFTSTAVRPTTDGYDVEGVLTIKGRTQALAVPVRRAGERLVAEVSLDQRAFGIRPYTAMLGALRVRAEVTVRVELPA